MGYQGKRRDAYERALERHSLAPEDDERGEPWSTRWAPTKRDWSYHPWFYRLWPYRLQTCLRRPQQYPWFTSEKERTHCPHVLFPGEYSFAGGESYRVDPLDTLKMVSASSVFGEPQYCRDVSRAQASSLDKASEPLDPSARHECQGEDAPEDQDAAQVMERVIDAALDTDFGATLRWAVELRERYLIRLSPQVILVRAAAHPGRRAFTAQHPGEFERVARRVMSRADDVAYQVEYWVASHGSKRGIPAILKRTWARRVGDMGAYEMARYCNSGIGLVDVTRICHAKGPLVDSLMREGRVPMPEGHDTWERLRASGMGWRGILATMRMPHAALLRNLRGIFDEVDELRVQEEVLDLLRRGVRGGRQHPFRYFAAWKTADVRNASWSERVKAALEDCMEIACDNLPWLAGRSAFLVDTTNSMRYCCMKDRYLLRKDRYRSRYAEMSLMEIAIFNSVIGMMRSDEGAIFLFDDTIERIDVHGDGGILAQVRAVRQAAGRCFHSTMGPLRLFLDEAVGGDQHWENIFVYSDISAISDVSPSWEYESGLEPPRLIQAYRERVNPKVNVYSVLVDEYESPLLPDYRYRATGFCSWTGKELLFADAMGRMWDKLDERVLKGR